MKVEYNNKNKNDAASLIFKELYEVSSLSDTGEYVDGKVKKEQIKVVLYSHFYQYKTEENDTWGILTSKNIDKVESIEEFYNKIISELVALNMIESYGIFSADGYKLTLLGFKYNLKLASSNSSINLFIESEAAISAEISYLKTIKIPESKTKTLIKDLLEIIYLYKNNYNKKIQIHELIMRYLSSIEDELSKYSNLYDVEESKLYDKNSLQEIKKIIENEVYSSFRRDLIFYDNFSSGLIDITPSGIKYLLGDKITIENEEKLSGLNKEISIIHISDLHFGSSINDGIDNKDNLKGVEGLKVPLFNNFKKNLMIIYHKIHF
ncbi:hypothetical protein CDLVIII_4046 [Clostridium sp. DL-VIII]|uniref:hypothetical protein n=1 Tax=Clostridium sp. DL-VIII TaxID=641107 RepID=UPI00023AF979|nr:hypothetical protein [Clostridium sp. DL-VIII]EHJ00583.1 hypothetical protein CDLVIII_4046 [Clostridium sp. DL-VIII]